MNTIGLSQFPDQDKVRVIYLTAAGTERIPVAFNGVEGVLHSNTETAMPRCIAGMLTDSGYDVTVLGEYAEGGNAVEDLSGFVEDMATQPPSEPVEGSPALPDAPAETDVEQPAGEPDATPPETPPSE